MRKNEDEEPNEEVWNNIRAFHPIPTKEEGSCRQRFCAVVEVCFARAGIFTRCVEWLDPRLLVDFMNKEGGDRSVVLSSNWAEHFKVVGC